MDSQLKFERILKLYILTTRVLRFVFNVTFYVFLFCVSPTGFHGTMGKCRARAYLPTFTHRAYLCYQGQGPPVQGPPVLSRWRERAKMAPSSTSVSPERVPTGPCPSSRPYNISKWIFSTCNLGTFQAAAFVLVSWVSESICKPFKKVSQFPTVFWVSHTWAQLVFKVRCLEAHLFVAGPRVGVPDVGHKSLIPKGEALDLWDLSQLWVTESGVRYLARLHTSLPLWPISMWPFYCLLWRSYSPNFQVFFSAYCFICSCIFSVSVGGGEFRIFCATILDHPPPIFKKIISHSCHLFVNTKL